MEDANSEPFQFAVSRSMASYSKDSIRNTINYFDKEYSASDNASDEYDEEQMEITLKRQMTFIVDQSQSFNLGEDIWCYVSKFNDDIEKTNRGESKTTKLETIKLTIYSKTKSVDFLKSYVDSITEEYMDDLYMSRHNKLFIYSLQGFKNRKENEIIEPICDECSINSSRTFDTIFSKKRKTS